MGRVFFLSLAAALNAILVAASTVMSRVPNPRRLMRGYLLGAPPVRARPVVIRFG
jgi:hypothetical protein